LYQFLWRKTATDTQTRIVHNHFSQRFEGSTSQIRSYLELEFSHDANTSMGHGSKNARSNVFLRIFQRFRLVKFIEKFKLRVKNLKIIAFNKYYTSCSSHFISDRLSKNLFLTSKNNEVADLTHFSTKCGCFLCF